MYFANFVFLLCGTGGCLEKSERASQAGKRETARVSSVRNLLVDKDRPIELLFFSRISSRYVSYHDVPRYLGKHSSMAGVKRAKGKKGCGYQC